MIKNILLTIASLYMLQVEAINLSVLNHTSNPRSQDKNGEQALIKPNLGLSLGHHFGPWWGHYFAPEIGYIFNKSTDDTYGDQTKRTIYLLYDLAYPLSESFFIRYGFANFMTQIKGNGGEVEVPNSTSSSATAYRPEKKVTSYTSSLNLGLEFKSNSQLWVFKALGIRAEAHVMKFLSSEQRVIANTLVLSFYF